MAAGEPGALHPSDPLQGHLAETGFKCPGGEVVAAENRAGLAVELARDHPHAERGYRGEHVRAALRGGDRAGAPVGKPGSDPGAFPHAEPVGRPRDDLASDEAKMRVRTQAAGAQGRYSWARRSGHGRAGSAALCTPTRTKGGTIPARIAGSSTLANPGTQDPSASTQPSHVAPAPGSRSTVTPRPARSAVLSTVCSSIAPCSGSAHGSPAGARDPRHTSVLQGILGTWAAAREAGQDRDRDHRLLQAADPLARPPTAHRRHQQATAAAARPLPAGPRQPGLATARARCHPRPRRPAACRDRPRNTAGSRGYQTRATSSPSGSPPAAYCLAARRRLGSSNSLQRCARVSRPAAAR